MRTLARKSKTLLLILYFNKPASPSWLLQSKMSASRVLNHSAAVLLNEDRWRSAAALWEKVGDQHVEGRVASYLCWISSQISGFSWWIFISLKNYIFLKFCVVFATDRALYGSQKYEEALWPPQPTYRARVTSSEGKLFTRSQVCVFFSASTTRCRSWDVFIPAWGGEEEKKTAGVWSWRRHLNKSLAGGWINVLVFIGKTFQMMSWTHSGVFCESEEKRWKKVMKSDSVIRTDSWSSSHMVIIKKMC